jgi:hypothetical protein
MRHASGAMFINQQAGAKPIQTIGRGNFIGPVIGDQIGKNMP